MVLSERLKRLMKWLRALILKDDLTSLQNGDLKDFKFKFIFRLASLKVPVWHLNSGWRPNIEEKTGGFFLGVGCGYTWL